MAEEVEKHNNRRRKGRLAVAFGCHSGRSEGANPESRNIGIVCLSGFRVRRFTARRNDRGEFGETNPRLRMEPRLLRFARNDADVLSSNASRGHCEERAARRGNLGHALKALQLAQ